MRFVSSKQDKNIYRDFSALYKEAFPKEERAPLFFLKAKAKKKVSDCFGIYDEDTFVGLLNLIYHKDIVFVFYFAVRGDLRGKGYGSQILDALKEKFPARRLILTIEDPNAPCENREQRQKRKAFYQKNRFAACGYSMIEKGIAYQALSFGGQVSADELQALLKAYMGGFWYRLYYKF